MPNLNAEPAARQLDPGRAGLDLQDLPTKRLVSLGLGEEQLQDVNRPASPANARVQIIVIGKFETVDPVTPAAAAPKGAAAGKKKKR